MRGFQFKTKDIVITSEGAFSKSKESQRLTGNPNNLAGFEIGAGAGSSAITPPPVNQDGDIKLPKADWRGAAGVVTGFLNQAFDRGKEALGFSDTDTRNAAAAVRSLKALNNQVIITVATTNAILQKSGKITDFGRKLTEESLPTLGIGTSEAGFGNEVALVVDRLEKSRDQLRQIEQSSSNKKSQREAGEKALALDGLAKEYRKILKDLDYDNNPPRNIDQILRDADAIVGRGG